MKFTLSVYNYQWFLENMELSRQLQTSVNYLTFNILLLVLFIVSILVRNGAYSSSTPYMPKLIGCPIYSMFLKSKVCYLDYPKYWGVKCCKCRVEKQNLYFLDILKSEIELSLWVNYFENQVYLYYYSECWTFQIC